jgi:hypothetical protein
MEKNKTFAEVIFCAMLNKKYKSHTKILVALGLMTSIQERKKL